MASNPETQQNRNTVSGDMAAGDINKNQTNLHYQSTSTRINKIKELFALYEFEKKNNVEFKKTIEELDHYITPRANEPVQGIENKLTAGNRGNYIEYALEVKELYYKKITINEMLESSQLIHVYLLALVKSCYMNHVYPLVLQRAGDLVINNAIHTHILIPVLDQLEGDTIGFTSEHIIGMLYFLTGNCHLKWTN